MFIMLDIDSYSKGERVNCNSMLKLFPQMTIRFTMIILGNFGVHGDLNNSPHHLVKLEGVTEDNSVHTVIVYEQGSLDTTYYTLRVCSSLMYKILLENLSSIN